jgi:hypothetical protein
MWTWFPFTYPRKTSCINKGFVYIAQKRTFEHLLFTIDCINDIYKDNSRFQINHLSISGSSNITNIQPRFISNLPRLTISNISHDLLCNNKSSTNFDHPHFRFMIEQNNIG